MVRAILFALFILVLASATMTVRACSQPVSEDPTTSARWEKIAILDDGSVMFAPDGTVARTLADWLKRPDGKSRWFELGGTQFEGRSIEPTPFTKTRLPRLAQMLKAYPDVKARLVGHSASTDDPAADLKLSQDRAHWVVRWLEQSGVAPVRLSAEGVGSSQPLFPPSSSQTESNGRITLSWL